jgi:amidohydrolase
VTLPDLAATVASHEAELIAFRRIMHSQPELSGQEYLTTEMLVERLAAEGLATSVLGTGTGLVCDISLHPDEPADAANSTTVALRADIDALAMDDLSTSSHRSRHPGIAHACGHDVHTAALLGAALALLQERHRHPRRAVVRLLFEPAEEAVPGGAVDVINEGWLEDVDAVFGLHCDPKLDTGRVGLRAGALTSAADLFEITLTGPGGHTARPELTVDLVRWAGRVADRLADRVSESVSADVTVVLGALHTGAAANVIPASAVLRGSFRTPDRSVWVDGEQLIAQALVALTSASVEEQAPEWTLDYTRGVPPVVNDASTTAVADRVARHQLGGAGVAETPQSRGGDSFAWYTDRVPGTYIRLGTHDPKDPGERRDLHSATFDVDEAAIAIGAALLAGCALEQVDGSAG